MAMGIRFVAEYYDTESGEIIDSKILRKDKIQRPTTLKEFGYLHEEQIELLKTIQDFKLLYETKLINTDVVCPKCNCQAASFGSRQSNFHAVFTDHKINIQRRRCRCGWSGPDTVEGLYGSSLHPDLMEMQLIQGSENSYRQASRQLNAGSKMERKINNDDRIRRNVGEASLLIEQEKLELLEEANENEASSELIAVIDGGHLKSKETSARSFEAMIATVFRSDSIRKVDKNHNEIRKKTTVASAVSDGQVTIKNMILMACRNEGLKGTKTQLTCLTDGANNCWSIANSLKPYCKKLIMVLDWFHITKRFTVINNQVDDEFEEKLSKIKWFLWRGNVKKALERLGELIIGLGKKELLTSLEDLSQYIKRNEPYIANYYERQKANLPFTSTIAESSVNELINTRQKNNKKMQWSREGAHSVLQIRASKFSKTWEQDWGRVQKQIYNEVR